MKLKRAKYNLIWVMILLFCAFLLPAVSPIAIKGEEIPLGAVDYLDFQLSTPRSIYADEEIVMVSCGEKTVFFYDSKIYTKDITVAGQIYRLGNKLYYSSLSLLKCLEIGVFEEMAVSDTDGKPIAANNFSLSKEGKLITLTNTGAVYYQDFAKTPVPYEFDDEIELKNVQIADGDYFYFDGEIYLGDTYLTSGKATYFTTVLGKVYFSNNHGIYRIENGVSECVYKKENSVLGISGYGDGLLFIDGETNEIMSLDASGNVKKFLFSVEIQTDAKIEFLENPETVTVINGARKHKGTINNATFTYDYTEVSSSSKDYIKLGSVSIYSVLFGLDGYMLVANEFITEKEQNTAITFDKGYILHDCDAFILPVAMGETACFALNKNDEVNVLSKFIMNEIGYYLIEKDGEKAFVLSGEITDELLAGSFNSKENKTIVTGKNNTLIASVIMLVSAGVFSLALFVILAKKQYFKI